ncbi:MAG: plasmid mobilization relaxosome protein MobC [Blautia sp.]|nr:plasmid mobilization relaxosome protein MobC [Blautia sp.]
MRKRNYTVTVRMNKVEYELLQRKVRESGRTQQAVVIAAIAELKIASTEEIKELKRLNELLAEILRQLKGAASNINQIARRMNSDGFVPRGDYLTKIKKNIIQYRRECEDIWRLIRRLISGQIHMVP